MSPEEDFKQKFSELIAVLREISTALQETLEQAEALLNKE